MSWFKKEKHEEPIVDGAADIETTSGLKPLPSEKIQEILLAYYEKIEPKFWNEIKEDIALQTQLGKATEAQIITNVLSKSPFRDAVVVLDMIVTGFMGSNEFYAEAEKHRVNGEHLGKFLGSDHPSFTEYPEIISINKALQTQLGVKKDMSKKERDKLVGVISLQTLEYHHKSNDRGDSGELTSALWVAFSRVAIANIIDFDVRKGLKNNPLAFPDYLQKIWLIAGLLSVIYCEKGRDNDPRVKEFLGIKD